MIERLTLILILMTVFACEPNPEPYNGEKAIFASIEKSKKQTLILLEKIDQAYKSEFSNIEDVKAILQQGGMTEAQAKNSIMRTCPVLFSEKFNAIELVGNNGIDAGASLRIAREEAEKVDFSNEQEVNKAIKKIDDSFKKVKIALYSVGAKVVSLIAECLYRIQPKQN